MTQEKQFMNCKPPILFYSASNKLDTSKQVFAVKHSQVPKLEVEFCPDVTNIKITQVTNVKDNNS